MGGLIYTASNIGGRAQFYVLCPTVLYVCKHTRGLDVQYFVSLQVQLIVKGW